MLNKKESNLITQALIEPIANAATLKTYTNDVLPLLNRPQMYSSVLSHLIKEKITSLLTKNYIPQNFRKQIWPSVKLFFLLSTIFHLPFQII